MRFIYRNLKTFELLSCWASPRELETAAFFFWNSGTPEQRSLSGFLKALLYEVLDRRRDLIPVLLPRHWAKAYVELLRSPGHYANITWRLSDLMQMLRALADPSIVDIRLFLLIDGLDEYEGQRGDYEEMAGLLCSMVNSPNIKICVSSRPLLVFEDAFRQCPGLRLQDLTYRDIKLYVSEKLGGHPRFQRLAARETERAPALIEEVVAKANGVSLWVRLVVESLISGFRNRDGISDLQRRLFQLPSDLKDLYRHIIYSIEDFYILKASETLQLVRAQRNREPYIGSIPLGQEFFTIFALAMADSEDNSETSRILNSPMGTVSLEEIDEVCSEMADRLKVRCAGLLELRGHQEFTSVGAVERVHWHAKVQYLHRTARDYIESELVWQDLTSRTRGTSFDAYTSLFRSGVLQLMQLSGIPEQVTLPMMLEITLNTLNYASLMKANMSNSTLGMVESIDAAMCHFQRSTQPKKPVNSSHWVSALSPANTEDAFLSLTIQSNLPRFVKSSLDRDSSLVKKKLKRPLLAYAVSPVAQEGCYQIDAEIVQSLLEHGADPNERVSSRTVWEECLLWQARYNHDVQRGAMNENINFSRNRATIMRLMLEYGASRNVFGQGPGGPYSVLSLVMMFMAVAPEDAKKMHVLLTSMSPSLKRSRKREIVRQFFGRGKH